MNEQPFVEPLRLPLTAVRLYWQFIGSFYYFVSNHTIYPKTHVHVFLMHLQPGHQQFNPCISFEEEQVAKGKFNVLKDAIYHWPQSFRSFCKQIWRPSVRLWMQVHSQFYILQRCNCCLRFTTCRCQICHSFIYWGVPFLWALNLASFQKTIHPRSFNLHRTYHGSIPML